jgi:hypothetical protein
MRIPAAFTALVVGIALAPPASAQDTKKPDASRTQMEVIGCVKGSTLTENPSRRWRLRGPKALMNQIKEQGHREMKIAGTTKNPQSGMAVGSTRVGKANIYIGGNTSKTARDPLPDLPTIDVESFEVTGDTCVS